MKAAEGSGKEGSGQGAGRARGQRLPDGVRSAAQAAQERRAGAQLAYQDAKP